MGNLLKVTLLVSGRGGIEIQASLVFILCIFLLI